MCVTRQVVQIGLCVDMTRTVCNRRVFCWEGLCLVGSWVIISLPTRNHTVVPVYFLMVLSGRDVFLCLQISLYPQGKCVST